MNANFLYILLAFVGVLCHARPQQTSNINIPLDSEIDYQDYYQPTSKLSKPVLLARPAKARSPVIPSISSTQNKATPVPILKQINRHNEDGSYTYGFEGADGSFKIETKLASGEVIGKYGYVDDSGKTRVVEYGANKYGFQPAGEGITVPPATITNDTETDKASDDNDTIQEEPSTPKINVKMPNPKRKPLRPSQAHHRLQRPKPSAYLVQELDENSVPSRPESNQRQLITPGDINSLQYLLGGDLQEVVAQYPSNEMAQRKSNLAVKLQEEEAHSTSNRPLVHSFPIPAIFEMSAAAQQAVANNEFAQSKFVPQYELPDGTIRGAISKSQNRNKLRPQYLLISPVDDAQFAQSVSSVPVRRHSSRQENRSILDELIKQYSIPNMAAPINNFSFGYTSN